MTTTIPDIMKSIHGVLNIKFVAFATVIILTSVNGELIVKPVNTTAAVGEQVTLTCSTNRSGHSVQWNLYKKSCRYECDKPTEFRLKPADALQDLVIESVTLDDSGWYKCVDQSGLSSAESAYAYLNVFPTRTLATGPDDVDAMVGDTIHLECRSEIPEPVSWHFTPIGTDQVHLIYNGLDDIKGKYYVDDYRLSEYQNLTVRNVTVADCGHYTCAVYEASGKPDQTKTAFVNVTEGVLVHHILPRDLIISLTVIPVIIIGIILLVFILKKKKDKNLLPCFGENGSIAERKKMTRFSNNKQSDSNGPPNDLPSVVVPASDGPPKETPSDVLPVSDGPPKDLPSVVVPASDGPPEETPSVVVAISDGPPKATPSVVVSVSDGPPEETPSDSPSNHPVPDPVIFIEPLLNDRYDILMLFHKNDKDRAEIFVNIVKRCVELKQPGMELNVCFDLNDLPPKKSASVFDYLEEAFRRCNVAFVICSEHDNSTNWWNEFQQQSLMMEVIERTGITVVPVYLPTVLVIPYYFKLYQSIEINDLIRKCSDKYGDLVKVNASELIIGRQDGNLDERCVRNVLNVLRRPVIS